MSLNLKLDFEEQVRTAEIQLKDDRAPTVTNYNANAQAPEEEAEEQFKSKLNEDSFLFNSKYRLDILDSAGASKPTSKDSVPSRFSRPEKKWLHNTTKTPFSDWPDTLPPRNEVENASSKEEAPAYLLPLSKVNEMECGLACVESSKDSNDTLSPSDAKDGKVYTGIGRGRISSIQRTPLHPKVKDTLASSTKPLEEAKVVNSKNEIAIETHSVSEVGSKLRYISQISESRNIERSSQKKSEKLTVNLVDRNMSRVAFGCISVGDVPGRTLIRGVMLMLPISSFEKFIYYDTMKQSVGNCGIEELNVLQKSVAPHLLRGDDCFIIGGRGCGKSLSYLIPVVGSLVHEFYSRRHEKMNSKSCDRKGPLCIIICPEFKSALKIEGHLFNLVADRLVVALVCDDRRDTRAKCEIGVDIMVTTLSFAVDMLKRCHSHFKFDRLRYMIFEEVDIMTCTSPDEFENVRTAAENFVLKNPLRQPYQRIHCGHEWNKHLEKLYFDLPGLLNSRIPSLPTVFIQSRNQAIRYSNMKWKMYQVAEKDKIRKIYELLKSSLETVQHKNIFIVCSCPEVAFEVHTELEKKGIHMHLADMDKMSTSDIVQLTKRWDSSLDIRRIMVLHDSILRCLEIHDVTCLIHYDLPLKVPQMKSSAGADRFSCMWGYFRDISREKENLGLKYARQELVSYFLLTGMEKELHKLKLFALKMDACMPLSLSTTADEIGKLELNKKPVCSGMKFYGKCAEPVPENCPLRHMFLLDELEETPTVPRSGEIEIKITSCVNPSYYVGQILRYYELKDRKRLLKNNHISLFNERTKHLDNFYATERNKVPPQSFDKGTSCAVYAPLIGYTRAKIEKIMTRTSMNFPKTVRVFCIDHGEYLQPRAEDLFELPVGYEELSNLSVNVVLANLKPPDDDADYRLYHVQKARKLTVDKILHGKIRLSIGNTVWLNPLVEMHKDPCSQQFVKGKSIRLELINIWSAENNDWHIENLIDVCKGVGFSCPEFLEPEEHITSDDSIMSKFFGIGDEIRWAFVQTSTIEDPTSVEIWTSFIQDPYNLFGTNDKFDLQLDELNSDLNKAVTGMIAENFEKYDTQFELFYEPGLVVAVKDKVENKWVRGMIKDKYQNEGVSAFEVFLVDIGDQQIITSMKDVFPMPYDLVKRLPFQAVAFELAHIMPTDAPNTQLWSQKASDQLIDLTLNENGDARKVSLVALQSKNSHTSGCRYYTAIILMETGEELGSCLVDKSCATYSKNGLETVNRVKSGLLSTYNKLYDNRDACSETDDEDDNFDYCADMNENDNSTKDLWDRWDIQGFDASHMKQALGVEIPESLIKKHAIENNSAENAINLLEDDDAEIRGKNNQNTVEVNNGASQASGLTTKTKNESTPASKNEESSVTLPPFSDLLHPKIFWKQTKKQFILIVNHPDIISYSLQVDGQKVSLRTEEPVGYGFDIVCYGRVESTADEFLTGQYLRIKLNKKVKNFKWPMPLKENLKFPWFKEDPENLHSSDEDEGNATRFPQVPVDFEGIDDSDDNESLDSDDDDPEETEAILAT